MIMKTLEHNATVAAIATASGPAGIAVVRISGPEAGRIADAVTKCPGKPPSARQPGSFFHAQIVNPTDGAVVDDAIVLVFRAPASFTGEDVVEIQGHGGDVPVQRVLNAVLIAGARPAPPGEFTRRAFLNGKLDLTQAEAVMDLIQARSEQAASAAQAQLSGLLGQSIDVCYEAVANLRADIEAQMDFESDALPPRVLHDVKNRIHQSIESIKRLQLTWKEGHLLRTGATIVICGRPNVGKSSLMNALLGKNRAIVSAIAGTTRDLIEESILIEGIVARLVDTAGLRETSCPVENDGVSRAKAIIKQADVIVYVFDSSQPLFEQQRDFRDQMAGTADSRTVLVFNKYDLPHAFDCCTAKQALIEVGVLAHSITDNVNLQAVSVSALTGDGLGLLLKTVAKLIGIHAFDPLQHPCISTRHRNDLLLAEQALVDANALLDSEETIILAAEKMKLAVASLGRITGKIFSDDLLDRIFNRFCVGK